MSIFISPEHMIRKYSCQNKNLQENNAKQEFISTPVGTHARVIVEDSMISKLGSGKLCKWQQTHGTINQFHDTDIFVKVK